MKNVNTTVIDLGIGNLMSIIRGLEYHDAKVTVTSDPNIINNYNQKQYCWLKTFINFMMIQLLQNLVQKLNEKINYNCFF